MLRSLVWGSGEAWGLEMEGPACKWTSFSQIMCPIWRIQRPSTFCRLMEGQLCIVPGGLGQSKSPYIKGRRIRGDGGERSSAAVITHLHTCTPQTNARLTHHLNSFDRALAWIWLLASVWPAGTSSFLVRLGSIVSRRSKESPEREANLTTVR